MCVNFRPVATFFKLKFLTILFRVLDDVSREPATCYRCNAVGHVSTKCRTRDVNCQICKNKQHVTDACYTKRAPRTTATTAGSAPRLSLKWTTFGIQTSGDFATLIVSSTKKQVTFLE